MTLSRRQLMAAGSAAALFPSARVCAQPAPTPKLLLLMQSNGTPPAAFWPPGATLESTPVLAPLLAEPRVAASVSVIRGLFNRTPGAGNEHDVGFAGLWTGKATVGTFTDPWGDGPSIDHQLARAIHPSEPFPTFHCGVLASTAAIFKAHRASFSYLASRRTVPTEIDPFRAFAAFFSPNQPQAALNLKQRRSVLDWVRRDVRRLENQLPAEQAAKLSRHADALRTFERRLEGLVQPDAKPHCLAASLAGPALDVTAEASVPALLALWADFIALALSCGLVRIVTYQLGQSGERWRFRWLGLDENSHDHIFHRDDGNPAVAAKSIRINTWYAEQVTALTQALARQPEQVLPSLLDETLLVWGNEMGTGLHGMTDIPAVLVGGAAGRLPGGQYVNRGAQTYHRLGTTVLRLMGVPAVGFGDAPTCGGIEGLRLDI